MGISWTIFPLKRTKSDHCGMVESSLLEDWIGLVHQYTLNCTSRGWDSFWVFLILREYIIHTYIYICVWCVCWPCFAREPGTEGAAGGFRNPSSFMPLDFIATVLDHLDIDWLKVFKVRSSSLPKLLAVAAPIIYRCIKLFCRRRASHPCAMAERVLGVGLALGQ